MITSAITPIDLIPFAIWAVSGLVMAANVALFVLFDTLKTAKS